MPRPKIDDKDRQSAELVTQLRPADASAWRALLAPGETPSAALRKLVLKDLRKRQRKAAAKPLVAPAEPVTPGPQSPLSAPPRGAVRVMVGVVVTFPARPGSDVTDPLKSLGLKYDGTRWHGRIDAAKVGEAQRIAGLNPAVPGTVTLGPGGTNG